ncbi:hypothetical protein WR25_08909 [Diploscapter pachys]|uniref:DAGKc domain-containing protein n=1 Tax=Diploscapter pachys TaxID=2018661 RepID=A0A2A2KN85_9BILA|nr:hypothetical protein WR25_08909 [Diploscapter pachys]
MKDRPSEESTSEKSGKVTSARESSQPSEVEVLIRDGEAVRGISHLTQSVERTRLDTEGGVLVAEVDSLSHKRHRILFDRNTNLFEFQLIGQENHHSVVYRLDELLCVQNGFVKLKGGVPQNNKINTTIKTLYFYFVYRKNKHLWRVREIAAIFDTNSERDYWLNILTATLTKIRSRPKNIIVYINPFGGKGKAKKIFQDNVEPFFRLTPGLKYSVLMTERANHARDHILEMEAEKWYHLDGLVSVGGDGLFNELLSGALLRTQRDAGRDVDNPNSDGLVTPHIRFGIIGAGSANSIVSTVHETSDYPTAAVHIAIGSECNVDVCTVHQANKLIRISANAISYGWLGDVLRDSETYRCLGPVRYQWSALRTTIRHPIYRGTVKFTLSHKDTSDPQTKLPKCIEPCKECESRKTQSSDSPHQYDYHWHAEFTHVICCVIPTVTPFTPHGLAPFTGIGDGTLDLAMVSRVSRCQNIQFMRRAAMYGGKELYKLDRTLNVYRVIKWSYQPDEGQPDPGTWNLDGEILEQTFEEPLQFALHPQLISFFGRDAAQIKPTKSSFIKKRKSSIIYQ